MVICKWSRGSFPAAASSKQSFSPLLVPPAFCWIQLSIFKVSPSHSRCERSHLIPWDWIPSLELRPVQGLTHIYSSSRSTRYLISECSVIIWSRLWVFGQQHNCAVFLILWSFQWVHPVLQWWKAVVSDSMWCIITTCLVPCYRPDPVRCSSQSKNKTCSQCDVWNSLTGEALLLVSLDIGTVWKLENITP